MADLTWVGDRGILVASDSGESLASCTGGMEAWGIGRAGLNF